MILVPALLSMGLSSDTPESLRLADAHPTEILVKLKPGASPDRLREWLGGETVSPGPIDGSSGLMAVSFLSPREARQSLRALSAHPEVLYAEAASTRRAFIAPQDPDFDLQWNLHNNGQDLTGTFPPMTGTPDADLDAPDAWNIQRNAPDIIVALVDSGVDYSHPDLGDNVSSTSGWNLVGNQTCSIVSGRCNCSADDPTGNPDFMDDYGHGTASAGIIAANANNSVGITGLLWTAQIHSYKFLDKNGCGSIPDETGAVRMAINAGARIIVINAGGSSYSQMEFDAIRAAGEAGILVVAPAGNEGSNNDLLPIYPAGYDLPNMISVAASDPSDRLAYFSNYGPVSVDLAAPGDCVYTTMPTGNFGLSQFTNFPCHNTSQYTSGYDYVSGTSFAAAHVAGVAALLLAQDPSLTPPELKAILLATADPIGSLRGRVASGGRLNAHRALTRDIGSSFTGGTGGDIGCGTILPENGDHPPGPTAWATLIVMFLPLALSIRSIRKRIRSPAAAGRIGRWAALTAAAALALSLAPSDAQAQADSSEDAEEKVVLEYPHFLLIKLGLHRYPKSDYFSANQAFFDQRDLISPVGELEYDFLFHPHSRFGLAVGRYAASSSFSGICCSTVEFDTRYLLMTVKFEYVYRTGETRMLRFYAGPGIGFYDFHRKTVILGQTSRFEEKIHGFHFTAGIETALARRFGLFLETRLANAVIASADAFDDELNIGGYTALLGLSWTFPFSRPALSST